MTLCVHREVQKAVNAAQSLHRRWSELLLEGGAASKEEVDWTTNELRNSLRSIEWDLEDLDETINILHQSHCRVIFMVTKEVIRGNWESAGITQVCRIHKVSPLGSHLGSPGSYQGSPNDFRMSVCVWSVVLDG